MFDFSAKRQNHFLHILIMTQCSVGNKITGFGVSHLGSNVHLLICDFRQVIKCLGASVFSSLRCDANTYLIGML